MMLHNAQVEFFAAQAGLGNLVFNTSGPKPITSFPNIYGAAGSPLANSPPFQANLRVRDELTLGRTTISEGNITYDAAAGISKDAWGVQLFGQNLTNVNASTGTNSGQFVETETVIRPRNCMHQIRL